MSTEKIPSDQVASSEESPTSLQPAPVKKGEEAKPREMGGREGLEPTRYGDWEKAGRCIDF